MKRSKLLLMKRKKFINEYVAQNNTKQMKVVVAELSEKLFISERTIYNILNETSSLEYVA